MSRFLKSRQTMWARAVILFIGVVFHYNQALAVDTYMAEFMIESNATFNVSGALSAIKQITTPNITMTIGLLELTAECKIVGNASTCNCSSAYIWSNDVCGNFHCCNDSYCNANISHYPALCIPKVKVRFNGTVQVKLTINETDTIKKQLTDGFKQLHGFGCLNVSGPRDDGQIIDFKVDLSVIFLTDTLAKIISDLEPTVGKIAVETSGLVSIQYPMDTVKFFSKPMLNCRFEEKTNGSWNWNLLKGNKTFDLNTGSSITVSFPNETSPNCTTVQIIKLSGNWAGIYKCGFSKGSIVHTASAELKVALLPDKITMTIDPLTVECQDAAPPVTVTATIDNSTEQYTVTWSYQNNLPPPPVQPAGIASTTTISLNCSPSSSPHVVIVNFINQMNEIKSANITIPVIYAQDKNQACPEENNVWPKTPKGVTVTIRKCEVNRVGYKERTCKGPEWMSVLDNCVNEELNKVVNAAANFKEGLGATLQVAIQIFSDLKKSMVADSAADLSASINVLDIMSRASETITLDNSILDTFLDAASNMLNNSWKAANKALEYDMSSKYLLSVEGLVNNIKMNTSDGNDTPNIQLKLCNVQNSTSCNDIVFGVEVKLALSSGIVKTVGVKNLADKLNNSNFPGYNFPDIVVSVTLQSSNDSKIDIQLDFPINQSMAQDSNILCVFWNTTLNEWSEEGCKWKKRVNNRSYCECTHLTSFSVLMSKIPVTLLFQDEITYVGLGVSICSLLIFLIIEALVWSAVVKSNLSHFRHTALVNISLCLLLADCSFLAACFSSIKTSTWCLILTVTKQFFFLAMFCWMLCLSIMLLHQLIFIFHPLRKSVYLLLSTILGYICPTVIVSATYVYYKYTGKPYHNTETCWLTYEGLLKGSIHAFLLPVGTIVLLNLFSMAVVIMTLLKSTVSDGSKADEKEAAKSIMKVMVFLTPVFGVTWALGFFVLLTDIKAPMGVVMRYAFTIINSFQGLFILLTGCFAEKRVRDEVLKLFLAGALTTKGKSESIKNLTKSTSNN
ncbi:adhesion G-protein coupled receptor F3 isoform X2 [Salmo salar]|uniref:Adhesion G-protein coupled receptor F3 isoform X2 n=1 Tax=Salmo salar TaxID=8030 RepID=A0A1S3MAR7_SALSA|nr:adhesion G-protein coupled receptor F3-like isoform X2 [Salmo salar]|eukprot:XP_014000071.1 PREDICTED: adhesion G-protein coupled receptor F3-like isoform X1 [Salmo salar]